MKIIPVLAALLMLFSCEEGASIATSNEFPFKIKEKRFSAVSARAVYSNPVYQNTTLSPYSAFTDIFESNMIGMKEFRDEDGLLLYRAYVRPIFRFELFLKDYRKGVPSGDSIMYTSGTNFKDTHNFRIKIDSTDNDLDEFNQDFDQSVTLKLIDERFILNDTLFTGADLLWQNSMFSEIVDPAGNKVTQLGQTTGNLTSGEMGQRTTYDIEIDRSGLETIYNTRSQFQAFESDDSPTGQDSIFRYWVALDMTDFTTPGMAVIDSLPQLTIRYVDNETQRDTTRVWDAISSYYWITYEPVNVDSTELFLLNGGRRGVLLQFDADSLTEFLASKRIFGGQFRAKSKDANVKNFDGTIRNIFSISREENSKYADGLPFDSIVASGTSISFAFSETLTQFETNLLGTDAANTSELIYNAVFRNWIENSGVVGAMLIQPRANVRPGIYRFQPTTQVDSIYELRVFYSDREGQ